MWLYVDNNEEVGIMYKLTDEDRKELYIAVNKFNKEHEIGKLTLKFIYDPICSKCGKDYTKCPHSFLEDDAVYIIAKNLRDIKIVG